MSRRLLAQILAPLLLALIACSSESEPAGAPAVPRAEPASETHAPAEQRPNIILISIDTLRADHLGSYGYERDTSPHLDALAERSLRYSNAYAPAPWTLPSHVAMLSGRHPFDVGIVDVDSSIPSSVGMLAEGLGAAGYQTTALVDSKPSGLIGGERGFARGFERYDHAPLVEPYVYKYDVATTVTKGLEFMRDRSTDRPFFLFLHTKAVHANPFQRELLAKSDVPYNSPEPFGSRYLPERKARFPWHEPDGPRGVLYLRDLNVKLGEGTTQASDFPKEKLEELIALYDGGIRYTDHQLQRLFEGIAELGLDSNTVIIITSDHGEAFLEHYFLLHKELFTPLLHVPLIVHDPRGVEPGIVSDRVSLMDITPTILELVGLPGLEGAAGRPLPPKTGGPDAERTFFSFFRFDQDYLYQAYAVDDGQHRLIHHKLGAWPEFRTELFDLAADPAEATPIEGAPGQKEMLLGKLVAKLDEREEQEQERIELDEATIEHLRSLGYLD